MKGGVTPKQIRIIKMACRQLGIDDAAYRQMLARYPRVHPSRDGAPLAQDHDAHPVTSATQLHFEQADDFISTLIREKGFKLKPQPRRRRIAKGPVHGTNRSGKVVVMVSAEEIEKIDRLAELIEWRVEDGFRRWCEKRLGIKKILTGGDAEKVIEGLKKMFSNQMFKQFGARWWDCTHKDSRIQIFVNLYRPSEGAELRHELQEMRQEA